MNNWLDFPRFWRRPAVVAATVAAGALGVVAVGTITGSAQAGEIALPEITANTAQPTFNQTLPPLTFVTVNPLPTAPPATLIELPDDTLQTVPGSSTTTEETTTTTGDTTTTLDTTTTTTTEPAGTDDGSGPSAADPVYTVEIAVAEVECDGTINVEYSTTADPAPDGPANHIVMFNAASTPADFTVFETEGNPSNGSFAFAEPGAADQTYRLLVIALYDPANPEGPKAIDQADVALVDGC